MSPVFRKMQFRNVPLFVLPLAAQTAASAKGRESWLYFSVPEKPVAGAPVVIYFNRSQSEPLQ